MLPAGEKCETVQLRAVRVFSIARSRYRYLRVAASIVAMSREVEFARRLTSHNERANRAIATRRIRRSNRASAGLARSRSFSPEAMSSRTVSSGATSSGAVFVGSGFVGSDLVGSSFIGSGFVGSSFVRSGFVAGSARRRNARVAHCRVEYGDVAAP